MSLYERMFDMHGKPRRFYQDFGLRTNRDDGQGTRDAGEMQIIEPKIEAKPERKKLYYSLYCAARLCVDKAYQNNTEAIKTKRDAVCDSMFGKAYDKLTDSEIIDAINELNVQNGATSPDTVKPTASKSQLKLLRFYQVSCALIYCDFKHAQYVDEDSGEVYSGNEVRQMTKTRFELNNGYIPNNVLRLMYENWINPQSHKLLIQGDYKKFTKNDKFFHYEYLRPEECQYLITRFQKMYEQVSRDMFNPSLN